MRNTIIFVTAFCIVASGIVFVRYQNNKPPKDTMDTIRSDATDVKFTLPKTQETCVANGGVWKKIGIAPVETCNIATKDAGKPCENSKVCEGSCIVPVPSSGLRTKPFRTKGTCSAWAVTVGCWGFVADGWASVLCVD